MTSLRSIPPPTVPARSAGSGPTPFPRAVRAPGLPTSAWRLRSDAWDYLAYCLRQMHGAGGPDPQLMDETARLLAQLDELESYWAFPGHREVGRIRERIGNGDLAGAGRLVSDIAARLRQDPQESEDTGSAGQPAAGPGQPPVTAENRPRFDVLVVDDLDDAGVQRLRAQMEQRRRPGDAFVYEPVVVPSFEDAVIAVLLNPEIQACVIRPGFASTTRRRTGDDLRAYLDAFLGNAAAVGRPTERIHRLAGKLAELRPELDLYLVAGVAIEDLAGTVARRFRRIFRRTDSLELHLSLLAGVQERHRTPFYTALQRYSQRPGGAFHALPISRGKSVVNSRWIREMGDFFGLNVLLAETSATSGGLDSLLDPHGALKDAQQLAARAFGARHSYFVTNGTSTANKIVTQSIVAPGDVVLVDRNCHKSHHYALMLAGARVAYLDAYPLDEVSFYGAVPLRTIKATLLDYRRAGRLDEVKMIALTNCTFDGIVYDPERVMAECLAIKPDLVFLWDEAWFAFAAFHPVYRRRTAMAAAGSLQDRLRTSAHRQSHAGQQSRLVNRDGTFAADEVWLDERLIPPATARIRVYATQSTHKTLTSLRQGSMIHVHDADFDRLNGPSFHEAYMTHTSTSPSYQVLASLDMGRRQVELEGYELVQKQADLAAGVAKAVSRHKLLRRYFRVLGTEDLIPAAYRGRRAPMPLRSGLAAMAEAWRDDEFVIDPSRLTLHIGLTGVDGDTFKHGYLMDRHGIQVNKTSRNTVLLMTNIGTTRSSVAYLIEVLVELAEAFGAEEESRGAPGVQAHRAKVAALTATPPPLPDFSRFAARFTAADGTTDGNVRAAYYESYRSDACAYVLPAELAERIADGEEMVSAAFVTPYPPGFPVLVPGQVITADVLAFMAALDTREIHGLDADLGYRVLTG